jgi:hypothetical protein
MCEIHANALRRGEKQGERERKRERESWWLMKAKNLKKERQRERDRVFEYENTSIWILELGVMCLFLPEVKGSNIEWAGVGKRVFDCFLVLCLGNWTLVRNGLLCVTFIYLFVGRLWDYFERAQGREGRGED